MLTPAPGMSGPRPTSISPTLPGLPREASTAITRGLAGLSPSSTLCFQISGVNGAGGSLIVVRAAKLLQIEPPAADESPVERSEPMQITPLPPGHPQAEIRS